MNAETTFTPGPWRLQESSHGGKILLRGHAGRGGHPQSHLQIVPTEDAHLIAAAPDLFAALEAFLDGDGEPDDKVVAARSALKKARGEA